MDMTADSMFGRFITAKVLMWKAQIKGTKAMYWLANRKHVVFLFYVLGVILGWIACSEWQIYLQTGEVTTFPWE